MCSAYTFRAARVERLALLTDRAHVNIVGSKPGTDTASVVLDAIKVGRTQGNNVLLVDTVDRLHTNVNLMAELKKIRRLIERDVVGGPHDVLLVLDSTIGQNSLIQARRFLEGAAMTGSALTKLDGTANGGIAIAVVEELRIPIRYVDIGEDLDDFLPLSTDDYVEGLFAN